MKKARSDKQKLAELVAKQRGIKYRSAQSWLSRVASGKVKKPKLELTKYAKTKVKKFVKAEKEKREKSKRGPGGPDIKARKNFHFGGLRNLKMFGRVAMGSDGSGDLRDRWITQPIDAETANHIFNAPDAREAMERFADEVPYLNKVIRFAEFEFDGQSYREGFFD
jgi:hypothetical protein